MSWLQRLGLAKATLPTAARQPEREQVGVASSQGRMSWESQFGFGFNPYARIPQSANLKLYEDLVNMVPVINAALERIVQMVGCPQLLSEDEAALEEHNEWRRKVNVNRIQSGFDNFFATWVMDHLVYGRSHAEMILTAGLTDVHALQELHTRTIELKPRDRGYGVDLVQNLGVFGSQVVLNPDLILTAVHDVRADSPQGNSLLFGLPFVTEIYGKMLQSLQFTWERFGVPNYHVNQKMPDTFSDPQGTKSRVFAQTNAAELAAVMKDKAQGRTREFSTVGDVTVSILGADGEALDIAVPGRHILEQIVAKTGIPPMLLGIQWATTERMSWVQAQILSQLIHAVRGHLVSPILYLFRVRQALAGRPILDAKLEWEAPSLIDLMEEAKADLAAAQADKVEQQVWQDDWKNGVIEAWQYAQKRRPELEGKTKAEVLAACPNLLDQPMPMMEMPAFGGGEGGGEDEDREGGPPRTPPFGRSADLVYGRKWGRNGRH